MSTAVVLFTRDLRARDHPALAAAVREHRRIVPLFVLEPKLLRSANRAAFLLDSLADLRSSLGGALVIRRGDPQAACAELGASVVYVTTDWSPHARRRERRLQEIAEVRSFPGNAIVEPGTVAPSYSDHYRVFTPYWRAWRAAGRREIAPRVARLAPAHEIDPGELPTGRALVG